MAVGRTSDREDALGQTLRELVTLLKEQRELVTLLKEECKTRPKRLLVLDFMSLKPPTFTGSTNRPADADRWLMEINKTLNLLGVPAEQKICLATYLLEGPAWRWWEMTKETLEMATLTWDQFEQLFLKKYVPSFVRQKLMFELFHLTQGNLSVAHYDEEFARLFQYAMDLVPTEVEKIDLFLKGLQPIIRNPLISIKFGTYDEAVERALTVEYCLEEEALQQQRSRTLPKKKPKFEIGSC